MKKMGLNEFINDILTKKIYGIIKKVFKSDVLIAQFT